MIVIIKAKGVAQGTGVESGDADKIENFMLLCLRYYTLKITAIHIFNIIFLHFVHFN